MMFQEIATPWVIGYAAGVVLASFIVGLIDPSLTKDRYGPQLVATIALLWPLMIVCGAIFLIANGPSIIAAKLRPEVKG